MSLHKEYHKLPSGQEIKASIFFHKQSGYLVSVYPVIRTQMTGYTTEESGAFTGFKDTLLPHVDRQSAKRLETAKTILHERLPKYLKYPFTLD